MELVQDKAFDEEFMEDIEQEPLTTEKYRKKKDSLLAMICDCKERIAKDEDLHKASLCGVLEILKGKLKDTLQANLDDEYEDIKELKDGIKELEALNITTKVLSHFLLSYNLAKSDLKKYEKELEDLENQARQMSIFDIETKQGE